MYPFKLFSSFLLGGLAGLLIIYGFPALMDEYNLPKWLKISFSLVGFIFAFIVGKATFAFLAKAADNYELRQYDAYSKRRREAVIDWLQKYVPDWYEKYGHLIDFPFVEEDNIVDFTEARDYDEGYQMFKGAVKTAIRKYAEFYS